MVHETRVQRDRTDYLSRTFDGLLRPFEGLEDPNEPEKQVEKQDEELEAILDRLRRQRRSLAAERCKRPTS